MADPLYKLMDELRCPECELWLKNPARYRDGRLPQHFDDAGRPCMGSNKLPMLTRKPQRPLGYPRTWDWRDDANCLDAHSSLFDDPFSNAKSLAALEYCKGCLVLEQCWFTARRDPYYSGVMGGVLWIDTPPPLKGNHGSKRASQADGSASAEGTDAAQGTQLSIFS